MHLFAIIALAAAASAQESELGSEAGTIVARSTNGVRQVRQQQVNSFDLSNAISELAATQAADMSAIRELISATMGREDSAVTATVQAVATDMTARTMGLMSSATANAAMLDAVTNNLNGLTASVGAQLAAAAATQNAAAASMTTSMNDMAAANSVAIAAAITASASTGTALQTSLTRSIAAVNASMIASIRGKADASQHVWLGGCRNAQHGCWASQCLNGVELDTARPMFYKRTDNRMRAIVTGFYRMNMWAINTRNYAHMSVIINGQRKTQTYMYTYHGWWKDIHQDHTHLISAGQDFWFETCGHTHQWGTGNTHHRQEFHWLGTR